MLNLIKNSTDRINDQLNILTNEEFGPAYRREAAIEIQTTLELIRAIIWEIDAETRPW